MCLPVIWSAPHRDLEMLSPARCLIPPAFNEYPVRGSLNSLYQPLPVIPKIDPAINVQLVAQTVLSSVESALCSQNITSLAALFMQRGSYWRDQLAFTAHLRTFEGSANISKVLAELASARRSAGGCKLSLELQTASLVLGAPNLVGLSQSLLHTGFL